MDRPLALVFVVCIAVLLFIIYYSRFVFEANKVSSVSAGESQEYKSIVWLCKILRGLAYLVHCTKIIIIREELG